MVDKLIFFKKIIISPLFISIIFFLLLQLPVFNYGFNYRDEGYLLNNAQRINNGEIPYVDFSLAITPGAFYIQAWIFKLFGNYVFTDRISYIVCAVLILVISSRLFKLPKPLGHISLLFLALIYTGIGAFASYNIYATVFVMTSLSLFKKLKENTKNYFYAFLIGLINSLTLITKQTYGLVFFFSLLFLLIFFTKRRYLFINIWSYIIGGSFLPIIIFSITYSTQVVRQLVDNVFYFAFTVKNDRFPFIFTSILFIPFFIFVVRFIKKFNFKKLGFTFIFFLFFFFLYIFVAPTRIAYLASFYKESTIYYFILFFTIPLTLITLFFRSENEQKKQITITSIAAFSLFLASAFSGRDYTTVIVVAPLYIPLFIYLFKAKYKSIKLPARKIIIVFLLIIFTFPSIMSLFKAYGKVYKIGGNKESYGNLNINQALHIKIPMSEKIDLEKTIAYIGSIQQDYKLLCVPYCSFMNFLSGKGNASYFGLFYKFNRSDQARVISDLKENINPVILIQKPGTVEEEASYEDNSLGVLKTFVHNNYQLVSEADNFYVYK